jgi:hypothetical protein
MSVYRKPPKRTTSVHILDHGVCDAVPCIALELLEGEDLGKHMRGKLAPAKVESIVGSRMRRACRPESTARHRHPCRSPGGRSWWFGGTLIEATEPIAITCLELFMNANDRSNTDVVRIRIARAPAEGLVEGRGLGPVAVHAPAARDGQNVIAACAAPHAAVVPICSGGRAGAAGRGVQA